MEGKEEIRVLKYSWSWCARWVFPEVGYPVRIISSKGNRQYKYPCRVFLINSQAYLLGCLWKGTVGESENWRGVYPV